MFDNKEVINKIKYEYDQHGSFGVIRKGCFRIRQYLYYKTSSTWYELKLDDPIPTLIPVFDLNTDFLVEDKSEIIEWLEIHRPKFPWIFSIKEINSAIENKHPFFIVKYRNEIIGFVKVGIGLTYINDFDKTVALDPKTAFIYDIFVLPEYRGMNIAIFALSEVARYLKDQNFNRILCHIEEWNNSSIKAFKKAGFHSKYLICFIRIAGFSFYLRNRLQPFKNLEKVLFS